MKGNERIASMLAAPGTPHLRSTLASVLFLAWPAIIEQIMLTLVQYVDTAMVGSLGSNATAAVGVTSSTTWLFNGFFNAAAIGFSVQVAQHLGAGRQEDAKRVTWQSLRFVGIFGVLMGAIAFVLSFSCRPCWGRPLHPWGRLPVFPHHGLRHALYAVLQYVQRHHPLLGGYPHAHGAEFDD